jgi:outer membrane protein assembly factor BamB
MFMFGAQKMRTYRLVLVLVVLSVLTQGISFAQNWPRFRGPNGAGISDVKSIPAQWNSDNYHWRYALSGEGNSSPVVWGSQVYITAADADSGERVLSCINARTGKKVWSESIPFEKYRRHKNNSFASSTPAVDELHVYTMWHSPEGSPVTAYTHDGKKVWEFDLGPWTQGQGGASSPIVFGEWVFIDNDHREGSLLIALDRKTGREAWRIPREGKRACFTTPCVYSPLGRSPEIVFTHCYEGIVGVDAATGKQNWHIDVFGTHSQRAVGSPVVFEDLVIGSSGAAGGKRNVVAVRPLAKPQTLDGVQTTAEEAFRLFKSSPHVPTPIVYQGRVYLWEDKGVVSAYDARTGEVVWRTRAGGTFFSSPIIVDGRLMNLDVTGKVIVIQLGDKPEILAENELPEGGKGSMAVGAGQLLIRTEAALYAIGGVRN